IEVEAVTASTTKYQNEPGEREELADPEKGHPRDDQEHDAKQCERETAREDLAARPPLSRLIQRAHAPEHERGAQRDPSRSAAVEEEVVGEAEADDEKAEQNKDQFDDELHEAVWLKHGDSSLSALRAQALGF